MPCLASVDIKHHIWSLWMLGTLFTGLLLDTGSVRLGTFVGRLQSSLSGTFLQTLPELRRPLKEQCTLYFRAAVNWLCQCSLKCLGTNINKTVETTQRPSMHVNMRCVRSRQEKEFCLDSVSDDWFYLCWHKQRSWLYKRNAYRIAFVC